VLLTRGARARRRHALCGLFGLPHRFTLRVALRALFTQPEEARRFAFALRAHLRERFELAVRTREAAKERAFDF
jgi:hypothetical protein